MATFLARHHITIEKLAFTKSSIFKSKKRIIVANKPQLVLCTVRLFFGDRSVPKIWQNSRCCSVGSLRYIFETKWQWQHWEQWCQKWLRHYHAKMPQGFCLHFIHFTIQPTLVFLHFFCLTTGGKLLFTFTFWRLHFLRLTTGGKQWLNCESHRSPSLIAVAGWKYETVWGAMAATGTYIVYPCKTFKMMIWRQKW